MVNKTVRKKEKLQQILQHQSFVLWFTFWTFSEVRVTRSLVFCVMFYFSGVRVTRSLVLCVMFYFSGVRVTRSLVLCVMFYFSGVQTQSYVLF